jgi:SAM-dependent methyltransferase
VGPPLVEPGYPAFEAALRGPVDEIRERQRPYVADFAEAAPVLDLGCGRGEFLGLLAEAGVEARGVDVSAEMVAVARADGHDVEHADAVAYLERLDDDSLGGIFAAQLVEHLPARAVVRLLQLAATTLQPGGALVLETINPLSPVALRHFFADLTHAQPLVPETLELLVRSAGLHVVEVRFLNAPPPEARLEPVELPAGDEFADAQRALERNVERLNALLFAPLDFAVVARRPAAGK